MLIIAKNSDSNGTIAFCAASAHKLSLHFRLVLFLSGLALLLSASPAQGHETCSVTAAGGILSCTDHKATLTAIAFPTGASYQWTGPGILSGVNSAVVVVDRAGSYTVTTMNSAGCSSSTTVLVREWFVPDFVPQLPEGPVNFMVFLSPNYYFDLAMLNAPPGTTVTNGSYGAWCVKFDFPIETNKIYQGTLHYPYGADLPVHMQGFDWPRINYILNHKGNASAEDIQTAIWYFSGRPAGEPLLLNGVAQALVNDALTNGQCFVPQPCDHFAVAIDTGANSEIQWLIMEVSLPTNPAIVVTKACASAPTTPGGLQLFSGTVTNTGNITLANVYVFDDQPAPNTLILGPITLAPGAGTNFSGSYSVPGLTNLSTNVVAVLTTNTVSVLTTNIVLLLVTNTIPVLTTNTFGVLITNTFPVLTTNIINVIVTNTAGAITTNITTPSFGTINPVTQGIVDRFHVPTNLTGLTYADQDKGYAANQFYSMRKSQLGGSYLDTITAGTSAVTDRFDASSRNFVSLTFAAPDVGFGPLIFYYISHDNGGVSTFGTITPGGVVGAVQDRFVLGSNFDSLTFSATDVGYGANLFYYVRHDAGGISTFGTINPALPGTITDRFTIGSNVDALVFSPTDVGAGYGANNFYYLRHNSAGVSTFGTIFVTSLNTATVTDRFIVGTNANELAFAATDAAFGPNLFYFLKQGTNLSTNVVTTFSTNTITVVATNSVNIVTTNNVQVVITNNISTITTNSLPVVGTNTFPMISTNMLVQIITNVFAGISTDTVTASGVDICQGATVTDTATCTGTVQIIPPTIGGPGVPPASYSNGSFSFSFGTQIGVSYTVQFRNSLADPWTNLPGMPVAGTGGVLVITDSPAAQPSRFYRVTITP